MLEGDCVQAVVLGRSFFGLSQKEDFASSVLMITDLVEFSKISYLDMHLRASTVHIEVRSSVADFWLSRPRTSDGQHCSILSMVHRTWGVQVSYEEEQSIKWSLSNCNDFYASIFMLQFNRRKIIVQNESRNILMCEKKNRNFNFRGWIFLSHKESGSE